MNTKINNIFFFVVASVKVKLSFLSTWCKELRYTFYFVLFFFGLIPDFIFFFFGKNVSLFPKFHDFLICLIQQNTCLLQVLSRTRTDQPNVNRYVLYQLP